MAYKKFVVFALLFLASWASTTMSQDVMPCITKLMPCLEFLRSDTHPSSLCCIAVKNELENDVECLCDVFNDDKALKSFNITRAELIQFPTRCGLQPADASKCKKSGDTSPPPGGPLTPPKSPPKGPSPSGAGIGKSMIRLAGLLVIGGMLSIFTLF